MPKTLPHSCYSRPRNDSSLLNTFSVGSTSGSITLSSRLLDFEQYSNYTLRVRAVDNGSPPLSVTGYISIQVKDINEAPTAISLSNYKVFSVLLSLINKNAIITHTQFSLALLGRIRIYRS